MKPRAHTPPRVWIYAPNAIHWLHLMGCADWIATPDVNWTAFQQAELPEIPSDVWIVAPEKPAFDHPQILVFQPTTLKQAIDRTMQIALRLGQIQHAMAVLGQEEIRLMQTQKRYGYNHKRDSTLQPVWFLNPFDVDEADFAILEDLCEQSGGKLSFPIEVPDDPRLEGDFWCFSATSDATEPWFELSKSAVRAVLPDLYAVIHQWADWIHVPEKTM